MTIKKVINLPTLLFLQYCKDSYGINKGILNTIDTTLYRYGVESILERRKATIEFLHGFVNELASQGGGKKPKIGRGNLSLLLRKYMEEQKVKEVTFH